MINGFLLSFRSEFFKNQKTLGFWAAVLLPLLICLLLVIAFYAKSEKLVNMAPVMLWMQFAGAILRVMGSLLLPMYVIFIAYSVNNIEHSADTWKSLFSLPISRWAVYGAKYFYALFLVLLCLALFALFTIAFGNLLGMLKPQLRFGEYHMEQELVSVYFKLLLSSLGMLSIQFLLSLLWANFLKPVGVGFVCTISGVILTVNNWEYSYLFPYAHPSVAIANMVSHSNQAMGKLQIDVFTKEVPVSIIISILVFIAGYFIVLKKSVK